MLTTIAQVPGFFEFNNWSDQMAYFAMAIFGSVLFSIKLALMLFMGVDDGADFDIDDGGLDAHGGGFSLFSMLSILSFLMGVGWMGLACRQEWGLHPLPSAAIASGFGFSLMLLSSAGMYQMRKFDEPGRYNVEHCIGKTAQVYLRIPAKGAGRGQVQMAVDGRHKVLAAVSTEMEIDSFATVKVVGVADDQTLIVEPA